MERTAARRRRDRPGGLLPRLIRAPRALSPEQRLAGAAALALVLSMLLPWYEKNYGAVVKGRAQLVSDSLSAFGAFTFVEAAVLLVALGVLALLFARSERRPFHLPGGDGVVILLAGSWALLLLVWRLFDKPDVEVAGGTAATVGIQWGIFFALGAAAALAAAGSRVRAAHVPEPPIAKEAELSSPERRSDPDAETRVDRVRPRRSDPDAATRVASRPPAPPSPRLFPVEDSDREGPHVPSMFPPPESPSDPPELPGGGTPDQSPNRP